MGALTNTGHFYFSLSHGVLIRVLALNLNVPEQLLLDLVAAVLNDPLHLLVDELPATLSPVLGPEHYYM